MHFIYINATDNNLKNKHINKFIFILQGLLLFILYCCTLSSMAVFLFNKILFKIRHKTVYVTISINTLDHLHHHHFELLIFQQFILQ